MLILLSMLLFAATVTAQCPPTTPAPPPGPPNCANYPNGYFVNDNSNCQAYWYCANNNSQPQPGMCPEPYNFDQSSQLCNHPDLFPCPAYCNDDSDYVATAVREHNYYRNKHGVPNVASFSADINDFAQQWADYLASTDQFYHSGGPFGENLYKVWGGTADRNVIIANAIKMWYDEIQYYDWNNPGFSMEAGHFTQVVWKNSIEIGVGLATYPDPTYTRRSVVSINYRPPGNYLGQFEQNVLRPIAPLDSILKMLNSTLTQDEEKPSKVMVL